MALTKRATRYFKHEQLVPSYRLLPRNSFSAARVQSLDIESKNEDGTEMKDVVRCIAALLICLVAFTFTLHVEGSNTGMIPVVLIIACWTGHQA